MGIRSWVRKRFSKPKPSPSTGGSSFGGNTGTAVSFGGGGAQSVAAPTIGGSKPAPTTSSGGSSGGGSSGGGSSGGGSSSSNTQSTFGNEPVTVISSEGLQSTTAANVQAQQSKNKLQRGASTSVTQIQSNKPENQRQSGLPVLSKNELESGDARLGRASIIVDGADETSMVNSVSRTQFINENIDLPYGSRSSGLTGRSGAKLQEAQTQIETAGAAYDFGELVKNKFQSNPESFSSQPGFSKVETEQGTTYSLGEDYFKTYAPQIEAIGKDKAMSATSRYRNKYDKIIGEQVDFGSGVAKAGVGLVEFPINLVAQGGAGQLKFDETGNKIKTPKFEFKSDFLDNIRATPGIGASWSWKKGLTIANPENIEGSAAGSAAVIAPLAIAGGLSGLKIYGSERAAGTSRLGALNTVGGETLSSFGFTKIKPGVMGVEFTKSEPYQLGKSNFNTLKLKEVGGNTISTSAGKTTYGQDVKLTYGSVKTTLTGGTTPSIKTISATDLQVATLGNNLFVSNDKAYIGKGLRYTTTVENVPRPLGRYNLQLGQNINVGEASFMSGGKTIPLGDSYSFSAGKTFFQPTRNIGISDTGKYTLTLGGEGSSSAGFSLAKNMKPFDFGNFKITPGASAGYFGKGTNVVSKTNFFELVNKPNFGFGGGSSNSGRSFSGGGGTGSVLKQVSTTSGVNIGTSSVVAPKFSATTNFQTTVPKTTVAFAPSIYSGTGQYELTNTQIYQPKIGVSTVQSHIMDNKLTTNTKRVTGNELLIKTKIDNKIKNRVENKNILAMDMKNILDNKLIRVNAIDHKPVQATKLSQTTKQIFTFPTVGVPGGRTTTPGVPRIDNSFTTLPPLFALPFGGERANMGFGKVKTKQTFKYTPSFKAIAFGIKGKATKQTKFSGLEFRPIVAGELFGAKKKKKKGNNPFPSFRL